MKNLTINMLVAASMAFYGFIVGACLKPVAPTQYISIAEFPRDIDVKTGDTLIVTSHTPGDNTDTFIFKSVNY